MHKPKYIVEYAALVLIAGGVRILPLHAALALAWVFAAGSHFIGKIKVERTHQRIRDVFGDHYSEKEIRHIAWISWRNLFFNATDALRFPMLTLKKIKKLPIAKLESQLKEITEKRDGGIILATPHMGNWEIAGIAADLAGLPIFAIARKQKNPLVDGFINKMRQSFSLEILFTGRHMGKGVVDRIKSGKTLAVLPDINARVGGVTVDFLNGKATVAPGAASFAQMANCPIYPVCVRRIGWTQHDAILLDPILPDPSLDKQEDQQRIMRSLMAAISEEICKTPEQYFWYNKRWVLNPLGFQLFDLGLDFGKANVDGGEVGIAARHHFLAESRLLLGQLIHLLFDLP
jgi:KDO2-lipid IV(A) lauroyltransferase